jgi:cyclic beta-1,2-glucan synthetase
VHGPILDGKSFAGFRDTGGILKQVVGQERRSGFDFHILDELLNEWESPPARIVDQLGLLRRMEGNFRVPLVPGGAASWAGEMEEQVAAWITISDRYLTWIEILAEKTETEISQLGQVALLAISQDLSQAPSLFDLAHGGIESIRILKAVREESHQAGSPFVAWIDRVIAAFATAQWLAGETLGMVEQLIININELSAGMNMRFLYDPKRKLFAIGYNISTDRLDVSSYDLLASEARLGSFVAIARGDVPLEHWFSLSRPYGAIGRQRVLLSWTGTMFEYLMPLLFQNSYANSLLDKSAREAVAVQIATAILVGPGHFRVRLCRSGP